MLKHKIQEYIIKEFNADREVFLTGYDKSNIHTQTRAFMGALNLVISQRKSHIDVLLANPKFNLSKEEIANFVDEQIYYLEEEYHELYRNAAA